ncbi:MAG: glutamate-cysteine ligase family protein [Fimbriimonadales bacterium]|nr:MAG: hypothetical protein KatS3mg018_0258 [Fimbriimonadales bacterium]
MREASGITLGLEEEVFITTPTRPSLDALYALAKLLWRNPRYYYKHSASNFSRGRDARRCLMSSVEIATRPHTDIGSLLDELQAHRAALADAAGDAYLVPVGHLLDLDAPTNTAGLHIHIGAPADRAPIVYANLAHFLPLLILLSASSPYAGGRYFGQSYRVARSFAIGALRDDPYYRFQDLILSRRLGTVEIRVCDPVWDIQRLRVLLQAAQAIAQLPTARPIDRTRYAALRHQAACVGYTPDLQALRHELAAIYEIPEALLQETISDAIHACLTPRSYEPCPADASRESLLRAYACLNHAYRTGRWEPVAPHSVRPSAWRGLLGVMGYYAPRLPYMAYKAWAEWRAPIRATYSATERVAGELLARRADS